MSGLLVMLLAGPVCLLLAVSVIGIAVVPFLMCALLIAALLGKIAFARWIGMSVIHQDDPDNRGLSMRSFLIGSAIMCIAYMIPVLGFVTWALAGVFGLGASTLAFFSAYRRENPKPPRKVKVGPDPAGQAAAPPAPSRPAAPHPRVAFAAPLAAGRGTALCGGRRRRPSRCRVAAGVRARRAAARGVHRSARRLQPSTPS